MKRTAKYFAGLLALCVIVTGFQTISFADSTDTLDLGTGITCVEYDTDNDGSFDKVVISGNGVAARNTAKGQKTFDPAIKEVIINEGITEIGAETFKNLTKLETVKFPSTLETIGYKAFAECSKLTDVEWPASLKVIGEQAFQRCTSLTKAILPEGLTSLGRGAFDSCKSVKEILIPSTVTFIGPGSFRDVSGVTLSIYCQVTIGIDGWYTSSICSSSNIKVLNLACTVTNYTTMTGGTVNEKIINIVHEFGSGHCDENCSWCNQANDPSAVSHYFTHPCSTKCAVCGITRPSDQISAHKYSNDCDTTCDYCGTTRVAPHKYTFACSEKCAQCGASNKNATSSLIQLHIC